MDRSTGFVSDINTSDIANHVVNITNSTGLLLVQKSDSAQPGPNLLQRFVRTSLAKAIAHPLVKGAGGLITVIGIWVSSPDNPGQTAAVIGGSIWLVSTVLSTARLDRCSHVINHLAASIGYGVSFMFLPCAGTCLTCCGSEDPDEFNDTAANPFSHQICDGETTAEPAVRRESLTPSFKEILDSQEARDGRLSATMSED